MVINASGWKGKAKWVKAIEYLTEPIDDDAIHVYFDSSNKGGFSWIVPLPYGTLVGSLGYENPQKYLPKINKKILDVHGGAIPRTKPTYIKLGIGDVLGLIKIFTGGGIFSIAEILEVMRESIDGRIEKHEEKFKELAKEINKQHTYLNLVEKAWNIVLKTGFLLFDGKTINVDREFDLHSLLISRFLSH